MIGVPHVHVHHFGRKQAHPRLQVRQAGDVREGRLWIETVLREKSGVPSSPRGGHLRQPLGDRLARRRAFLGVLVALFGLRGDTPPLLSPFSLRRTTGPHGHFPHTSAKKRRSHTCTTSKGTSCASTAMDARGSGRGARTRGRYPASEAVCRQCSSGERPAPPPAGGRRTATGAVP